MAERPGGRGGSVETRFPNPAQPKQVDPKDSGQFTTPKGNKK